VESVYLSQRLRWPASPQRPCPEIQTETKAANSEVVATSEAFESKAGAEKGIAAVKKDALIATTKDLAKL